MNKIIICCERSQEGSKLGSREYPGGPTCLGWSERPAGTASTRVLSCERAWPVLDPTEGQLTGVRIGIKLESLQGLVGHDNALGFYVQ